MAEKNQVQALLQQIGSVQKQINSYRPMDRELLHSLQEKLRIEWTYNSNAIEGNTLTLGETAFFLREGLTAEGKPLKDYLEAKNHAEAIDGLHEVIRGKRKLTESLIKELHAVLMKDNDFIYVRGGHDQVIKKPFQAGQYKTHPNHVLTLSGKIHYYTDPLHVKDEMEKLLNWYHRARKIHFVEKAAIFHYRFVAIHPFDDGNGRMARLLMNLILMQARYLPCIIHMAHRRYYLEALEKVDEKKDFAPFISFVASEHLESLKVILRILQEKAPVTVSEVPAVLNREQRDTLILRTVSETALSIGQIEKLLPQIKRPTLKSDLKRLVRKGKIKKMGFKRAVVYFR